MLCGALARAAVPVAQGGDAVAEYEHVVTGGESRDFPCPRETCLF